MRQLTLVAAVLFVAAQATHAEPAVPATPASALLNQTTLGASGGNGESTRTDDALKRLFRARAGDRLGKIELVDAFVLAEIRPVVQLLQQHELRAFGCGVGDGAFDRVEVGV